MVDRAYGHAFQAIFGIYVLAIWILLLDGDRGLMNQWLQSLRLVQKPVFDIHSFWGIIWVHLSASSLGVKVLLLTPAFRNMDAALEETSRICGVGTLGTLRRIVVPIMAPAILVSVTLGLIRSLEAFEIELLLGVPVGLNVYSTKIYEFVARTPSQYAPATALGTFFLLILLGLVALQLIVTKSRSYRTITGHGFSTRPTTLGPWRVPACAAVTLLAVVITVVPMILLMMGTFMTLYGHFELAKPWTLEHWIRVFEDPILARSVRNTLVMGGAASAVGVVVYALVAYLIVKTRVAGRGALDVISWVPWSIPGVLLSLALLWTLFETRVLLPFYGTVYLLVLAMVIKSLPVGVQLTKSVLLQLGSELEEASRICGASWFQTYRKVVVPLLMPSLITIALLTFLSAARDISTVILLSTGDSRTLAVLALDYASAAEFEKGSVAAVLMVVMVVVAALGARTLGGQMEIGR
jgi:iron(III) transport system permease protein